MEITVFHKLEQGYNIKGYFYNSFYKMSDLQFSSLLIRIAYVDASMLCPLAIIAIREERKQ